MAKYVILLYFYVSLFQKHKKYKNIKSKNVGKVFKKKKLYTATQFGLKRA